MQKKQVIELYEKLYFHEIETREKLNSRLQIPLTIIISIVGLLSFLLQNYEHKSYSTAEIIFLISIAITFSILISAIFFFIRSWYNYTYSFLPTACETEEYRNKLIEMYQPYSEDVDLASKYFTEFLMRSYVECSSINTRNNDLRLLNLHKTNRQIVYTVAIAFISFLAFFLGNLEKDQSTKISQVSVISPITLNDGNIISLRESADVLSNAILELTKKSQENLETAISNDKLKNEQKEKTK